MKFSLKWLQFRLVPNCHCLLALHDDELENQHGNQPTVQSQSKWLGHFGFSLSPQCWCTRIGDQTAINNFERDEVSTRREKTAFG